ncbi:hypothetical protein SDC9_146698 [bioreactor metagenome]|uniref:Uncharacterized protein n=1 Tax=bioreactor metagenome TaxID=1076179 RepID=A0A645ECS7_9ZZZZ
MQAVEKYNGKSIIYSPGDLSYAATLDTTKASKETFIFRQSFTIENGNATPSAMNVFPVINTSSDSENDFLPTPVFDSRAETIINNLVTYSTASKYGIKKTDINYIVITKQ